MKGKMNRIISMILSAMLVFTALPEAVFAYDGASEEADVLTEAAEGEEALLTESTDGGDSTKAEAGKELPGAEDEDGAVEVAGEELPEADGASESEDNNSVEEANPISVNTEYSGNIASSSDKDYYRFHLDAAGVVSFAFAHDFVDKSDRLWKMRLYRAEYVTDVLMEREFRGNETQTLTTVSVGLPAGDYILLLTEYYWSDAAYRFKVNYTKSDAWEKERNETVTTPSDILTNKEYSGSIMESDDKDYYRFHLDEDGVMSFAFAHDFVDKSDRLWKMRLYRAEYVTDVLMEREFRGNETQTLTTASVGLPAGDYILLLTEYYWSDATYRFTVNYTKSDAWEKERNETV
nr:hypothetical protein [Lachnospiraceae bacterium]